MSYCAMPHSFGPDHAYASELISAKDLRQGCELLCNSAYLLTIDQQGCGESRVLIPEERLTNRGRRLFLAANAPGGVVDRTSAWSIPYRADCSGPALRSRRMVCDGSSVRFTTEAQVQCAQGGAVAGVAVELEASLALEESLEIWNISVSSQATEAVTIALCAAFSMERHPMGSSCTFDASTAVAVASGWPYHIRWEEQERYAAWKRHVFLHSPAKPSAVACSGPAFFGFHGDSGIPDAFPLPTGGVHGGGCSDACGDVRSDMDEPCAVFQFLVDLAPGGQCSIPLYYGCAHDDHDLRRMIDLVSTPGWTDGQLMRRRSAVDAFESRWSMHSGHHGCDAFFSRFLPRQIDANLSSRRFSALSCVRNELQDALGISSYDPDLASREFLRVLSEQRSDGSIRQWRMVRPGIPERGLALLHHFDGPVWLVVCAVLIGHRFPTVSWYGQSVLGQDGVSLSVFDRLFLAIRYLGDNLGTHNLVLFGDGDWTDPINGAGRLGRGESVWTTLAVIAGMQMLLEVARPLGRTDEVLWLEHHLEMLSCAVQSHAWSGDRYIAGYDDDGRPFGCAGDAEGSWYLNAQTWAVIARLGTTERRRSLLADLALHAGDRGPRILDPPYTTWQARIGKISLKQPGNSENGSVYSHGVLFAAYAACLEQDADLAWSLIRNILPAECRLGGCCAADRSQLPLYVPNFWFSLDGSPDEGRSSRNFSTGSAAWIAHLVWERLVGLRWHLGELYCLPLVPAAFDGMSVASSIGDVHLDICFHADTAGGPAKIVGIDGTQFRLRPDSQGVPLSSLTAGEHHLEVFA